MKRVAAALIGILICTAAAAQEPPSAPGNPATASATPQAALDALPGRWVRVEGGYVITIRSVGADGRLDAGYANPRQLPFSRAEASPDGTGLKLVFELREGGYNGSIYTLNYDPKSDVLKGRFFQAVAKQTFDVTFLRWK